MYGQIALGVGLSTNQKIGNVEEIDIEKLVFAFDIFDLVKSPFKETIKWVLNSAS